MLIFVVEEKSHVVDWETHRTKLKTEATLSSNGGLPRPWVSSPTASRVDYKGGGDLKSCFSEFSLNPLVAPPSVGHSPILPSIA